MARGVRRSPSRLTATLIPRVAAPSGFPPETSLTSTTPPTPPTLPTYLTPITDSVTGLFITRISNTVSRRHFYSRYQAWSFDDGLIFFDPPGVFPGRMINGVTYADIASFSGLSNAVMCNTERRFYGVDGGGDNKLYTQTFNSGGTSTGSSVKHTFTGYQVWIGGNSGSWEGGISDDDKYICLTLLDVGAGGGNLLAVYDTVADTFATRALPASMDNAQISRLGNYVVVVGNGETRVWPRALTGSGTQLWPSANHGDNALNAAGEEIFVTNNRVIAGPTAAGVASYRLSDGTITTLLAAGSAFEYGHVGGHTTRNGWIYLSVYDYTATSGRLGRDQVIALKTDGSGLVNHFCFSYHRTDGGVYPTQPHATPSRDGKRVLFASEWGATDVYAYVVNV